MKNKYVFVAAMLCAILVAGMGVAWLAARDGSGEEREEITVVTSFYPMYVAALNIAGDVPGVRVKNLSEPQTGCLHDFQLTPEDMKLLGTADVFVINGGGIESFMEDVAAAYPDLTVVEACEYLELLHDGDEKFGSPSDLPNPAGAGRHASHAAYNSHAWLSPARYREMIQTIAHALGEADRRHRDSYMENADAYDEKLAALEQRQRALAKRAKGTDVILFHEAFEYVAEDYGLPVRFVMDLDEERQVSAGEVASVVSAVRDGSVPLILAEERYGRSMAETVRKEVDVAVVYLDPLNRGDGSADSYLDGMGHNIDLLEDFFGR